MIVVKLMDGLGNQMFQYAFGRYLQTVYQEPIIFETMKLCEGAVRKLGIQRMDIPLVFHKRPGSNECRFAGPAENVCLQAVSKGTRSIAEKVFHIPMSGYEGYRRMIKWGYYTTSDSLTYYPFKKTDKAVKFVRGYFQSELYFQTIAPLIKKELRVKDIQNAAILKLAKKTAEENSVCIHVRRGDYVGNKRFEVCTESYYKRAVEVMRSKVAHPVFYVFSNSPSDLKWIKDHYSLPKEAHYVTEGKDELDDLYLMYHCNHHIISNSTFSWWGSYLCTNGKNITVAPARWVNSGEQQDILRKNWILL